nr:hypothetical protein [uncultured Allomuricauda sp.]
MRYTKYLAHIVKVNGLPNFTLEQYQKAMNIMVLECRIEGVIKSKKEINDTYKLDMLVYRESKKLAELTGNIPEKDFWYTLFKG